MTWNRLIHFTEGTVRIRAEAAFPERVLNLMSSRGIRFWALRWLSETEFSCAVTRGDYRALQALGERLPGTITVLGKRGVPYFARRFRRRFALLASLALAMALLALGSFCIWDFEIEGETPVSDEEILRALDRNGVRLGTFGLSVDSESLRNHVLLELKELSWIAVNVSGFKAHVQVCPRIPAPEIADAQTPVNIVASKDGLVERVEAWGGDAVVLPGSVVKRGDLLISGVADRGGTALNVLAAMGRVYARTWYTLRTELPLAGREKLPAERSRTALYLDFGQRRIKIFGKGSMEETDYDKITDRMKWNLFGILPLPVTTVRETVTPYETETAAVGRAEAEAQGEALLQAYLLTQLGEGGSVTATVCSAAANGEFLTVTLRAECREQIGKTVRIPVE